MLVFLWFLSDSFLSSLSSATKNLQTNGWAALTLPAGHLCDPCRFNRSSVRSPMVRRTAQVTPPAAAGARERRLPA